MDGKNGKQITIDKGHDIPVYSPVCSYCQHLSKKSERACKAFPDGIPMVIWLGENRHNRPFPGDGGIRFERWEE